MRCSLPVSITLLVLALIFSGCTGQDRSTTPVASPAVVTPIQTTVSEVVVGQPTIHNMIWKLGWYDDTRGIWSSVIAGSTITATFGNDEKVRGSGGCNDYSTDFHLGIAPLLWIRRPAGLEAQCSTPTGVMHQEAAYFTDLSRSRTYSISNGQLLIFDSTNKRILQYDPCLP